MRLIVWCCELLDMYREDTMDQVEMDLDQVNRIVAAFVLEMEGRFPGFESSSNWIGWGYDGSVKGAPVGIMVLFEKEPAFRLPTEFEFDGEIFVVWSKHLRQ